MKKFICMLLALLLVSAFFIGCGKKTDDPAEKGKEKEQTDVDPEKEKYSDDMDEKYDFDGAEYRILSRKSTQNEFFSESGLSSDLVEAAVFRRNETVMARTNTEIKVIGQPGDWGDLETFSAFVRADGMADTSEYSLIATHSGYLANLTLEGLGLDLAAVEQLNLEKGWWSKFFKEEVSYNGSIYFMIGDLAYSLYDYMEVTFFNVPMAEDLQIPDLYATALDGDWTFDLLKEYSMKVESNPEAGDDRHYGLLTNCHAERALPNCMGISIVSKDATTDQNSFARSLPSSASDKYDAIADFILHSGVVLAPKSYGTDNTVESPIFKASKALFYTQTLGEALILKEMEDDYGVLPFPKWDESQIDYYTGFRDSMTAVMIPNNVADIDMAGIVTELLSLESYNNVTDQYYEKTLKYQTFNDPRCVQMLDKIRSCVRIPFYQAYSNCIDTCNSFFSYIIYTDGKTNAATSYSANRSTWNQKMIELYKALDKIAGV